MLFSHSVNNDDDNSNTHIIVGIVYRVNTLPPPPPSRLIVKQFFPFSLRSLHITDYVFTISISATPFRLLNRREEGEPNFKWSNGPLSSVSNCFLSRIQRARDSEFVALKKTHKKRAMACTRTSTKRDIDVVRNGYRNVRVLLLVHYDFLVINM